jgi:hypothetical protein
MTLLSALLFQTISLLPLHPVPAQTLIPKTPVLVMSADHTFFHLTFTPGAVGYCTVFEQQVDLKADDPLRSNFPGGKYAPRHCASSDAHESASTDDWDFIEPEQTPWKVWVEVQYPTGEHGPATPDYPNGEELFVFLRSNVIEVVR